MVLGGAGVRRITQAIVQVAVNHLDLGMSVQDAIDAPRLSYEHRGAPLTISPHYAPRVVSGLRALGHDLVVGTSARVQAIGIDPITRSLAPGADQFGGAAGIAAQ
jgi:gamma-glutamyltranspeptidase/glutathione hydrolase